MSLYRCTKCGHEGNFNDCPKCSLNLIVIAANNNPFAVCKEGTTEPEATQLCEKFEKADGRNCEGRTRVYYHWQKVPVVGGLR